MNRTLKEIASLVSGELSGDPGLIVKNAANLETAQAGDLTFAVDDRSIGSFESSKASAAVVPDNLKRFPLKPHVKVHNLRLAMAKLLALFDQKKTPQPGVHSSAVISKSARIGSGCSIMSGVVIQDNVNISDNVTIYPGCFIGDGCIIGRDTTLYPNVTLYDRTLVGERCVIHAGAVIGVDGFGFVPLDGKHEKIPQIGNVIIEDDVEIFANSCISRATMGSTIIKRGTKIDNLTHIAHNCKIGEDCAITALVAIAGSSELGNHVSIGGTSGINDHVTIGENTVILGRSGVTKDIPANSVVSGFPAQDNRKELEQQAALRRLPKIIEKISEIEKQLKK
jgi:UDP-3-O-[3-hydroxymyristoyl] glucosamine N-acyltransferase